MKICMVLYGFFPPDIRVEKEARALLNAGHEIFLLSLGERGMPAIEEINGIKVIRVFPLNRHWELLWFNVFFDSSRWGKALADAIRQYKIDVIHVHDLPLVKTALSTAKKLNVPIIADLHENYPEAIKAWKKGKNSWKVKLFYLTTPIWRWKKLERSILTHVDRVITVVDEAKEHYINDCGIPPEKITVLMNTEDLEEFDNLGINKSLVAKYKNDFVISYIGGFGPHRGIDTAIKAMPKVLRKIPEAKLLLVGKGSKKYEEEMKKLCKSLEVENNVEFTGWIDFRLVPSYIAASDVCLVPHHSSGHTNTTIPHKLFQYMAMRKPVIVTDCKPLKRIVEETNSGMIVPSKDYNEMADVIITLYNDRKYARKLGENGRKAVEEKYNWDNEARKLRKLYEVIEHERSRTIISFT